MELSIYSVKNNENIITPALIYYKDIIIENTKKAIEISGNVNRLWPHVKSHKIREMIYMQMDMGIHRFKCATISEAEMVASCGANHVLLSYPLVGPNINRFIDLKKNYANTEFWAIGDNIEQLHILGELSKKSGGVTKVLIDVNTGMNRTGVPFSMLERFSIETAEISGISLEGFHHYDGHLGITDITKRQEKVKKEIEELNKIHKNLKINGEKLPILVMGGTPTFPCHAQYDDVFLSPGTIFINDDGYSNKFPDLVFTPGAIIMTRVVSHPEKGIFTIDLGYKGIASDSPMESRGRIVGYPDAKPIMHSEEHWTFEMEEDSIPPIGSVLYVIPTHICPTTALYSDVTVVENKMLTNIWQVVARDRKINF